MINKIKSDLELDILNIVKNLAFKKNIDLNNVEVKIQKTPNSEMGDLSILVFEFSKILQMAPDLISEEIVLALKDKYEFKPMGAYLNVKLSRKETIPHIINSIKQKKENYGKNNFLDNKKIMIEFSAPNTNKPLHVGHLRNDIIGESLSRILKFAGGNVIKVNLINNRGVHICKSMLTYEKFGNNITPEIANKKGDHLIGDFYVKYTEYAKENPNAENEVQDLLYKWEQGDKKTLELWEKLNNWAIEGIKETYSLTNISFDKIYLESETFELGKEAVFKGLEEGICYRREDGAVCIDIPSETKEDGEKEFKQKVLLRANGTSIYLTQDLGNIVVRKKEFNFNEIIYVVGSEQIHHFKVLFYVAEKLGIENSKKLIHLSHGMVNLPDGKMKSREGNIVDADNLIEDLVLSTIPEVKKRNPNEDIAKQTALKIALGAIHYYLLKTAVHKDILFNKEESLSFNGNSGPYIQYVGARINSVFEKYNELEITKEKDADLSILMHDKEWELIKIVSEFEEYIVKAAKELNPAIIVNYSYLLAKNFSAYYQDVKIIDKDNIELTFSRVELIKLVLQVIKNCMHLLNIPYMTKM